MQNFRPLHGARASASQRRRLPVTSFAWVLSCLFIGSHSAIGTADDEPAARAKSADAAKSTEQEKAASEKPAQPKAQVFVETPLELQPYKTLVSIAFAADGELDRRFRSEFRENVVTRLQSRMGRMWTVESAEDHRWAPASASVLARQTDEQLNALYVPTQYDKVFLVGVDKDGGRYDVFSREWDHNSRSTGRLLSRKTYDRRLAAEAAAELIYELFRPLALASAVDDEGVDLMIRAGEYLTADPDAAQFRPGDYLTVYFRYLDRKREFRQLQHIPWTFLRVESVERARMRCSVVSTFRSPLGGVRRRVELTGMRARPLFDRTELSMTPRGAAESPMVGYRVDVMDRMPTDDDPVEDRLSLTSDRYGVVAIPAPTDDPLRHLLVHSGESVLARVPMIPGLEPDMELNPPDDAARLRVEGALAMLEGDLIDIVSRTAVLMVRARKAADAERWEEVDEFIARIEELPDLNRIEAQIQAIEVPAVERSKLLGDRVAEGRIKRMCNRLKDVAAEHLDPQKLRDFQQEMAEQRSAS